ncbi:MAG: cytochrome c biogenesis protein ResB [Planctomycetota bacterium]
MKIFDVVLRFLSSKAMTVLLMSVMAIVMAMITVFEAFDGSGVTPFPLYYSFWFILLLALVWLNLLLNLFKASMWRQRRLPLTAAHFGFLLIMTGGYLTYALGVRGNLNIMEGDTGSVFQVEGQTLRIFHYDGNKYEAMEDYSVDDQGMIRGGGWARVMNPFAAGDRVTLENGEIVMVLDRLGSSQVESSLKEVAAGEGLPALSLDIGPAPADSFSLQEGESMRLNRAGFSRLVYYTVPEGEEPAQVLLDLIGEWITITQPDGKEIRVWLRIPDDVGKTLEESGYSVEVLEYHPDFKMGKVPSMDEPPLNPALRLHVNGPGGEKTLYTFAMHEFGGSRLPDGTTVKYHRGSEGGASLLLLSRGLEHVEVYASARSEPALLSPGESLTLGKGKDALTLKLNAVIPATQRESRVMPDPTGKGPPAFLVRINDEGDPVWLMNNRGEACSADGSTVVIVDDHRSLGFAVTLDDAVAEYWPASSIPKAFYSQVKVSNVDSVDSTPDRIETNAPLFRNGFRLYQSGMDQKPPFRWSTFSVAKDPGLPMVSAGFIVMSLGLLWLFTSRFIIGQLGKRQGEGRAAS